MHIHTQQTVEGVPGLSIGRNITIRILPSDDAFGVFSFSADSLSRLVSEEVGGTPVTLSVERLGGTFDDVSVYWEVEGGESDDISPTSGRIDFPEGVMEGELRVTINNDQVWKFGCLCVVCVCVCVCACVYVDMCVSVCVCVCVHVFVLCTHRC